MAAITKTSISLPNRNLRSGFSCDNSPIPQDSRFALLKWSVLFRAFTLRIIA
jgi:hypothetical protein